jgi:hypothetical protein
VSSRVFPGCYGSILSQGNRIDVSLRRGRSARACGVGRCTERSISAHAVIDGIVAVSHFYDPEGNPIGIAGQPPK